MARQNITQRKNREAKILRVQRLMMEGVTSCSQIATIMGISPVTAVKWRKEVLQRIQESDLKDAAIELSLRVSQLESIMHAALVAFQRSKHDHEEFRISKSKCPECNGKKKIKDDNGHEEDCVNCDGTGKVIIETTTVKGQAGDPAMLRIAKDCITEMAKLKGLYPNTRSSGIDITLSKMQTMATRAGATEVSGHIEQTIQEMYIHAPHETILKAHAMLEDLKEEAAKGTIQIIRDRKSSMIPKEEDSDEDEKIGGEWDE